ncbi:MAG: DNA recombination protein RmuC [Deltaproteobacteria bacterium]|nr:DNA recombination protein RmuC [Deltaproteobacteria bacterium]
MLIVLCLVAGAILGTLMTYFILHAKLQKQRDGFAESQMTLQKTIAHLENEITRLQTELSHKQMHFDDKLQMITDMEQKFENLSQKIFSTHLSSFQTSTKDTLGHILNPLKERIQAFESKVDQQFETKVRDITSLKTQIENIVTSNEAITRAAQGLTSALKGDAKVQGNWGELVLTKVLEASGLREGAEYTTQGRDLHLKNEHGQHFKPDVIIHLPEDKHIIIDSKVSLTNYEAMINADDEQEKEMQLHRFLGSVKKHIDDLGKKKYHHLDQLITPEFVLLFMPIEGAFSLALQNDQKMYGYAWNKGIVLVSPTTLLATLRTIESLWKMERQNQNALEIALQAGRLYDKFVGFVDDLQDIGKNMERSQLSYEKALNKLHTGKGNLIARVENLKAMGAKTSKTLPESNEHMSLETAPKQPLSLT